MSLFVGEQRTLTFVNRRPNSGVKGKIAAIQATPLGTLFLTNEGDSWNSGLAMARFEARDQPKVAIGELRIVPASRAACARRHRG